MTSQKKKRNEWAMIFKSEMRKIMFLKFVKYETVYKHLQSISQL